MDVENKGMAVVTTNYIKKGKGEKATAKAHIRYIQHRPGRTVGNHMTHSHCCKLAEISNPEQVWYMKTYHDLDCEIYSPEYRLPYYTGGVSSPFKTRNKAPQKNTVVNTPEAFGDRNTAIAKRNGKERLTRSLFGWDGAIDRQNAYRMIDEAEKGSYLYRMVLSPDAKTEDTKRDLYMREITTSMMHSLEERLNTPIAFAAAVHDDHTAIRHVHLVAVLPTRLSREDCRALIQTTTEACLKQRRLRDRALEQAREREEAAWEREA